MAPDGRKNRPVTDKQRQILDFIEQFTSDHGMPPTVGEIAEDFGVATPTAFNHLRALQKKGMITRSEKARSIAVLHPRKTSAKVTIQVPQVGMIRAGKPIFAEESPGDDALTLHEGFLGLTRFDTLYALTVVGDSMKDAGILDGDTIVVEKRNTANRGDIVVALVEDEATVKYYQRRKSMIELHPANDAYEVQTYMPHEVLIQGVVRAVLRRLS